MNRGVLQSSPVQQIMTGNPNWWSINSMRPPPTHQYQQASSSPFSPPPLPLPSCFYPSHHQFIPTSSSSSSWSSSLPIPTWHDNQELPESWSQLLLGGLVGEEGQKGGGIGQFHQVQPKKLQNWEEQQATLHHASSNANSFVDVKQENSANSYVYGHANEDFHHHQAAKTAAWSHQIMATAASSPKSSVTSLSSNLLNFSGNRADARQPPPDRSSEVTRRTKLRKEI